jgi:hypothetical protein
VLLSPFRRLAVAVLAVSVLIAPSPAFAAKAKAKAKAKAPVVNTAKYCAAAQKWLDFENATLATGPYDGNWVRQTDAVLQSLIDSAPNVIAFPKSLTQNRATVHGLVIVLWADLLASRMDLAEAGPIIDSSQIAALRSRADKVSNVLTFLDARFMVGEWTLEKCKIDVLQPFKDLAAGFN